MPGLREAEEEAVLGGLEVTAYGCLPSFINHRPRYQDPKAPTVLGSQ